MNTTRLISGVLALAMLAGTALEAQASLPVPTAPDVPGILLNASAECNAIGQREASRMGGSLYEARPDTQGGQPVCVITVVIPPRDGDRGRRERVVVPR